MTAYSRKEGRDDQGELVWEIRSVNHRFLEPFIRLPEEFRVLDPMVRERLTKRLGRGKVDCSLRFTPSSSAAAEIKVNELMARQVMDAAVQVDQLLGVGAPVRTMDLLRWPGVIETQEQDYSDLQKLAVSLLEETIDDLIAARPRQQEQQVFHKKVRVQKRIPHTTATDFLFGGRMPGTAVHKRSRIGRKPRQLHDIHIRGCRL
ncbi:MAG: hypothetical protein MI754_03685 [Chromatiales bacterium]|nr:hypothetical protein [Chromatiales bacterium]